MFFIVLLGLSALSIASVAAFYSILGLASIFTGIFWSVVLMGVVLEIGKLVAASFLYRYWDSINWLMKMYFISAVFILMVITSIGIYGMLSMGYQQDSLPLKEMTATIELLKEEKDELTYRKRQIDDIISAINPNFITKRIEQQEKFAPETDKINARLPEITKEIRELTNKKINQEAHTGPIIFIANAAGREVDDAIAWLVLLIVFVFDPLAVMLTIGTNMAIVRRKGLTLTVEKTTLDDSIDTNDNTQPVDNVEAMTALFAKLSESHDVELTAEQQITKAAIGEFLAKKKITQEMRNPNN